MFEGEVASLIAILRTGTVKVPKPIKVLDAPGGGSMLVMEHLDMRHLSRCVLAASPLGGFVLPLSGKLAFGGTILQDVIEETRDPTNPWVLQNEQHVFGGPKANRRGVLC